MEIEIVVNNISLDLKPGTKIPVEQNNTLFNRETIDGSYTYQIKLPFTDLNQKQLSYNNRLEKRGRVRTLPAKVLLDKALWIDGELNILQSNNDGWVASIGFDGFPALVLNKNLKKDFVWDGENIGASSETIAVNAWAKNLLTYPQTNIVFPLIRNNEFYGYANEDFLGLINWNIAAENKMGFNTQATGNRYNLVPQLFLFYILKTVAEQLGFALSGNFIADKEYQTLTVFNNYALDKGVSTPSSLLDIEIDYSLLELFYAGENSVFNLNFNSYIVGTPTEFTPFDRFNITTEGYHTFNLSYALEMRFPESVVSPTITIGNYDVIEVRYRFSIKKGFSTIYTKQGSITDTRFGINPLLFINEIESFYFSANDIGEHVRFVVSDVQTITRRTPPYIPRWRGVAGSINKLVVSVEADLINEYNGQIDYVNHVPDINVTDFLLALKDLGLDITYSTKTKSLSFNTISSIIGKKPKEIEGFVTSGVTPFDPQYSIYDKIYDGFILQYIFNDSDKEILEAEPDLNRHDPLIIGNGNKLIDLKFTPLLMSVNDADLDGVNIIRYLIPIYKGVGSSTLNGLGNNSTPLKLSFYRGIQKALVYDNGGGLLFEYNYAFSTSYVKNLKDETLGNHNLTLNNNADSIYKQNWRNYLVSIDQGEEVEFFVLMNRKELETIPLKNRIVLFNQEFLIDKANYDLDDRGDLTTVRLTLLKLNP